MERTQTLYTVWLGLIVCCFGRLRCGNAKGCVGEFYRPLGNHEEGRLQMSNFEAPSRFGKKQTNHTTTYLSWQDTVVPLTHS
jgi:hypothetical protein